MSAFLWACFSENVAKTIHLFTFSGARGLGLLTILSPILYPVLRTCAPHFSQFLAVPAFPEPCMAWRWLSWSIREAILHFIRALHGSKTFVFMLPKLIWTFPMADPEAHFWHFPGQARKCWFWNFQCFNYFWFVSALSLTRTYSKIPENHFFEISRVLDRTFWCWTLFIYKVIFKISQSLAHTYSWLENLDFEKLNGEFESEMISFKFRNFPGLVRTRSIRAFQHGGSFSAFVGLWLQNVSQFRKLMVEWPRLWHRHVDFEILSEGSFLACS